MNFLQEDQGNICGIPSRVLLLDGAAFRHMTLVHDVKNTHQMIFKRIDLFRVNNQMWK